MRIGAPVVVTSCAAVVGYVKDRYTLILVPPFGASALRDSILRLWENKEMRETQARNSREFSEKNLSVQVAGRNLMSQIGPLGQWRQAWGSCIP
jgi:glycosyltransferase involved in cell wall biosynthesis